MPGFVFRKGNIGIISKSGTLTYEVDQVVKSGFGISTAIGIGRSNVGTSTLDAIKVIFG